MKLILTSIVFSFLLFSFSSSAQYDDQRVVSSYYEFEEGSTEYLYGDNVVFRANPSSSAKAIDTLSIGSEIEIVRKTEEKTSFNGLDWNWYKVKVGRKTGYILAGLIALDRVRYDDVVYLVTVAGVKKSTEDWEYIDYKVRARVILPTGDFYGHETNLNTNSFYIDAFGSRGLNGVDNMLRINLFAEACGVDGGEVYIFNNGSRLFKALSLSSIGDGGVFWFSETVIFPEDEGGWNEVVRYEREHGVAMDEDGNWTRAIINTLNLKFENDQFSPNIEEFEFGEDD
ncbi:MAG: hypothetical protein COA38_16825 [Fluviicola sp.]|nr:MAG: hypothetical protein COA38_16825 [Fluviicola sp.]